MISVCLATFNGASFIAVQIHSILSEIGPLDELIISDDGSTDATIAEINKIKDGRIKLFTDGHFFDPIQNFQFALTHAKGDVVFLSDQDDVWLKGKYVLMLNKLKEVDLVVSNAIVTDERLQTIHPSFFKMMKSGQGIIKNVVKSTYYGSCMAFNKRVLNYAIPFPATKEIGHDLWLGLVAEIVGRTYFYDVPLVLYRRHSKAFTVAGVGKSNRSLYKKTRGRLIIFYYIAQFFTKYKFKLR